MVRCEGCGHDVSRLYRSYPCLPHRFCRACNARTRELNRDIERLFDEAQ